MKAKPYLGLTLALVLLVIGVVAIRYKAEASSTDPPPSASHTQMFLDSTGTFASQFAESTAAVTRSELVATHSFGGSTWTVAGAGSRLYYNAGADLIIADITDPGTPSTLGRWTDSDKAVFYNIYASDSLVYVPHMFAGVDIIDTSNASQPVQVGNIPILFIGGSANAVSGIGVSGTRAYITQGKLFRVVDVTVPDSPVNLAVITPTLGYLNSLVISDNYAYIAAGSDGLAIIDISTPTTPTVISTLDTSTNASGIVKQGSYVYISDYYNAVRIIDVSNPITPTEVGVYQPSEFHPRSDLAVSGSLLYVQDDYGDELHIINISTSSTPTTTGILQLPSSRDGLYLSGSTIYLGTSQDGLAIADISNPAVPSLLRTVGEMPYASSISDADECVFVASKQTLWVVKSQATSLTALPVFTSTRYVDAVSVKGGLAYLAEFDESDASQLEVLDVRNPFVPVSLGSASLTIQNARLVIVTGTYAYVGSWQGISAVNVDNPSASYETSWLFTPSGANVRGLATQGNYLYAATTGGLKIYDISDPATLAFAGEYTEVSASDVVVEGRYAYLSSSCSPGFRIIDVLTPTTPVLVRTLNTCGLGNAIAVSDGYAYLADGCKNLALYDVSDPVAGSSHSKAYAGLPSLGEQVVVSDKRILVADGSGGFVQLQRFEFESVSDYIPASGGDLTSPDGVVIITVPANTYTGTVWLRYEEEPVVDTGSLENIGLFFALTAYYTSTWELAPLPSGQNITVTLDYSPSSVREDTLQLYRFDGAAWTPDGISSTVDMDSRQVTAQLTTFSGDETFALLGESYSIYLPIILR